MKVYSAIAAFFAVGADAYVSSPTLLSQSRVHGMTMVSKFADPIDAAGSSLSMDNIPFDPLGLASEDKLAEYREAELKHGRLAMLAAVGWPAAELIEPKLSALLGVTDELAETGGRAPALLNGGLEEAQIPYFLLATAVFAGISDVYGGKIQQEQGLEPGNVGFDPLGLFPEDAETQEKYKVAELKHGRVAMVAIFLYALEEAISGTSILKETAPLASEVERLALEGPIQGNIDLVKDLAADAKALITDVEKEIDFYEAAASPTAKPLF